MMAEPDRSSEHAQSSPDGIGKTGSAVDAQAWQGIAVAQANVKKQSGK